MATKDDILKKLNVIEKKLPNGEVKEISVAVDEFSKLQTTQHTEMTYHFNDITKINEALKNLD